MISHKHSGLADGLLLQARRLPLNKLGEVDAGRRRVEVVLGRIMFGSPMQNGVGNALWSRASALAVTLLFLASAASAQELDPCVDVTLVLAVDGSVGVDNREYLFQQQAIASSFRDPGVIAALKGAGTVPNWDNAHWLEGSGAHSGALPEVRFVTDLLPLKPKNNDQGTVLRPPFQGTHHVKKSKALALWVQRTLA
jgi:hypothetical protein